MFRAAKKRRALLFGISILLGLPILIVVALTVARQGETQVEVPVREVEWPATLSGLPATVTDIAVDDNGTLWFLVLTPPDRQGTQVNMLYRYDPVSDSVEKFTLPSESVSAFVARIEVGQGDRAGKILVAWHSTLLEVDSVDGQVTRLSVPVDPSKVVLAGIEPATTRIYDIAVDQDGTVWVSRDHYPYLIAVYPDGSSKEFALPEGAGSPERLAVDGKGLVWATLIRHQPFSNGSGLAPTNAYRLTLRFDPATAQADVLPVEAWNIAGQRGKVVAMAGEAPAPVQRLDIGGSQPRALTAFGPTVPGDELAAGSNGDVWYRSRSIPGLVRVDESGALLAFPLPKRTITQDNRFGHTISLESEPDQLPKGAPTESHTPVLAIAVAPDGSAWFSTGDRIGHAVP